MPPWLKAAARSRAPAPRAHEPSSTEPSLEPESHTSSSCCDGLSRQSPQACDRAASPPSRTGIATVTSVPGVRSREPWVTASSFTRERAPPSRPASRTGSSSPPSQPSAGAPVFRAAAQARRSCRFPFAGTEVPASRRLEQANRCSPGLRRERRRPAATGPGCSIRRPIRRHSRRSSDVDRPGEVSLNPHGILAARDREAAFGVTGADRDGSAGLAGIGHPAAGARGVTERFKPDHFRSHGGDQPRPAGAPAAIARKVAGR